MADNLPEVAQWMQMTDDQIFDRFCGLPQAFSDGIGLERFVFVPGTRKDRVLLVAHADTVWPNQRNVVDIGYKDGILFSKFRNGQPKEVVNRHGVKVTTTGVGIGADDRAGCAIVWQLRNLGHSLLIVGGEEQGCIGTRRLMRTEYWRDEFNTTHSFAVEFDRRGRNDLVFYRVGTTDFAEYVKKETGYVPAQGSVTDISHLCRLICGVNLSVGYYHEHTTEEKLVVDQWQNTLAVANAWLSKTDLPLHPFDSKKEFSLYSSKYHLEHGDDESWFRNYNQGRTYKTNSIKKKKTQQSQPVQTKASVAVGPSGEQLITCIYCPAEMTDEEWFTNHFKCPKCKKEF